MDVNNRAHWCVYITNQLLNSRMKQCLATCVITKSPELLIDMSKLGNAMDSLLQLPHLVAHGDEPIEDFIPDQNRRQVILAPLFCFNDQTIDNLLLQRPPND